MDKTKQKSATVGRSGEQILDDLEEALGRARRQEKTVLVFRGRVTLPSAGAIGSLHRLQVPGELIRRVTATLESVQLASLGQGEFVGFVAAIDRRSDADLMLDQIFTSLQAPIELHGLPHQAMPRLGGALFDQENPSTERLLEAAALALQAADVDHPMVMFLPYLRARADRTAALADDLREAVLNNELTVALQPSHHPSTGAVSALKVMARWDRNGRGQVPPADFTALAAELGLMHLVSRQILQKALFAVADLLDEELISGLTLWTVVSPAELLHPDFQQTIADAAQLDSRIRIGLEVNPAPAGSAEDVHEVLRSMVASGARASLADFGRGHANLDVMERLPYDSVRLDHTLTRQMVGNDRVAQSLRALVELAKLFELEVTLGGVEDADQLALAAEMDADHVQGFHFTRPLPLPQLRSFLTDWAV